MSVTWRCWMNLKEVATLYTIYIFIYNISACHHIIFLNNWKTVFCTGDKQIFMNKICSIKPVPTWTTLNTYISLYLWSCLQGLQALITLHLSDKSQRCHFSIADTQKIFHTYSVCLRTISKKTFTLAPMVSVIAIKPKAKCRIHVVMFLS
jgi:hypothetical protein